MFPTKQSLNISSRCFRVLSSFSMIKRTQAQREISVQSLSIHQFRSKNIQKIPPFQNCEDDEQRLQDISVQESLAKISKGTSKSRGHGWSKSPLKIKQLRYTHQIMNLVSKGKTPEAGKILEAMRKSGVKPETAVYNILIAGYGRQGNVKESFHYFNQIKKHGLLPTDHTYTSMLSACTETGPTAAIILEKVEKEMERRDVILNNIGMNAHISALASCQRHKDALKVYLDMTKVGVTPDVHTYSGLLLASARDDIGGMIVAQQIWQEMLAAQCKPDLYTYNLLLQCLRDAGLEGSQVQYMKQSNLLQISPLDMDFHENKTPKKPVTENDKSGKKLNGVFVDKQAVFVRQTERLDFLLAEDCKLTLNIGYLVKSDTQSDTPHKLSKETPYIRWLDDHSIDLLFHSLESDQVKPDIRLFHLLLQLTLNPSPLLKRLDDSNIAMDEKIVRTALKLQARLGSVDGARAVLSYSKLRGVDIGQTGYQGIATCCIKRRDGLALLDEIKAAGIVPNEFVFGTLIGNALRSRNYEYVNSLLKKMRHFEVLPNDTIMEMLEVAANRQPKSPSHVRRHNGFKGYYNIWKNLMGSADK